MVCAVVEFAATGVTGDHPADRLDALQEGQTMRADVGIVAFHLAALEGQCVIRGLPWDAQFCAGSLPFRAMGLGVTPTSPLIGNEVGELVFEGAPQFFGS